MQKKMRRATTFVLAAAMIATSADCTMISAQAEEGSENVQEEFYVAPDGDDGNAGTSREEAFASIERARQAVDEINDDMTGDIIVNIAPGNYYLTETIRMGVSDSGTNGYEVIYRADGEPGSARIIGGQKVTGEWTLADEEDMEVDLAENMIGKVYKIELGEETPDFNTLYINGSRATMARTLNREDSERFPSAKDTYMYATGGGEYSISYPADQLPQEQADAIAAAISRGEEGCQVYGWDWDYRNWFTSTIPVTGISGTTLTFSPDPDNRAANRPKYAFAGGARFFLQGNLSFLDVPGEYHYNKRTNTLYYYPKEGEENLSEQEIIVPYMQEVFRLEGAEKEVYASAPDPQEMVHNITFEGLEAGYTEFTDSYSSGWNAFDALGVGVYPEEALQEGITQPSYCEQTERAEFRKGVFTLLQTSNITLDSMRIVNTGMTALTAWGDNDHITLQNSELAHIGFHGINIDGGYPGPETGAYSYGHLITNNVIHDVGELVGHGTNIQALMVHDSEFSHMEMYNSGRRAIFLEGAWANRTDQDANCNRYRDSHTYNNNFEYLYLHDLQQDGGDDGAIFFCTLYRYQSFAGNGVDDVKPNYLNQVYMDNVGAPPSNKDYKPNCINFDMGCGGVQASNIKAVNPQHYNIRYNEGQGEVTFDNVNMAYYHPMEDSNYENFDESRMEYDKIGVNDSFPYPDAVTTVLGAADKTDADYEDLYFRDEFDNELDEWWSLAGTTTTTPLYFSDNDDKTGNSFLADAFYNKSTEGCLIGKPFGYDLNKIVEIDFFDHTCDGMENGYCGMSFQYMLNSFARVDDGNVQRAIGVDHSVSSTNYAYRVGSLTRVTDVKREYGWHTFKWDYTGDDVKMYIDGQLIAEVPGESFSYIEMGDYGLGGFNAYDNVVVYGGEEAPDPIPLPEPPQPEEPGEEAAALPGKLEAEEADQRPGTTQIQNITGGKALGYLTSGDEIVFNVTAENDFELPLTVRYASNSNTAGFELYLDDEKVTDVVLKKLAGSGQDVWSTFFEMTTEESIPVAAGNHVVKIKITDNNFNLDYIAFMAPEEPAEPVAVSGIEAVVAEPLILSVGDTVTVPVRVFPENADNQTVLWSAEDENAVVSVTEDGNITANAEGTAVITARSAENEEITASFEVKVQDTENGLISTVENGCVPTADVPADHVNYQPEKLIDGKREAASDGWAAAGFSNAEHKDDPSAFLTWDNVQTVKTIQLYDVIEGGNYIKNMEIIFFGEDDQMLSTVQIPEGVPDGGMKEITLDTALENVKQIQFHILEAVAPYGNYGFAEIKVFSGEPGKVPANSVYFADEEVTMFPGETYTLNPPVIVPSTATNRALTVAVESGEDVIRLTPNSVDGVIRNYTVTSLKTGEAVIRATAENGVYADFTVTVGDKEQLGDMIMEAEILLGKFSGETQAHKTFRSVIDRAVSVYNSSADMDQVTAMMDELEAAIDVFEKAMNPEETAEDIAEGLELKDPAKGAASLEKPEVPAGFEVEIKSTNPEGIVARGWSILAPDKDTEVEVTLEVTKIIDGTTAEKVCTVTVPGYSAQEVLDGVEIAQPEKGAEKLVLPSVPNGFSIEIVSSTDDRIAADGTITWPLEDTEVTVKVRVTKASNDTSAEKDFTVTLAGIAKKLDTYIEADEIDAVYGPYIVVNNNEVSNFNGGDWIRYDNVDFGVTPKDIRFHINTAVHPDWAGKKIHVMLDDPTNGTNLGTITVVAAGDDWGIYGEQTVDLNQQLSGVHTIYLLGEGGEGVGGVKEIMFEDITPEPVEPSVVRELLQKTYDLVKDLSTEGVVDSAAKAFEEALANAKDLLENRPDAADEEMLEAWNRLVDATNGLGLLKGDKSILEALVSQAEEMTANADRYVAENWPQLEEALAEAKAVLEDGDAMDDTIRPAEEKLLDAILAQRYKANKDNLQALIDKANAIDLSQYTEESVSVFKAALKTANAVLADENLSQDEQAEVDSAAKELYDAVNGLVKTSDGGDSGDNGNGNTGDNGNDGSTGDNGNGNAGSNGDDSNTGAGGNGDNAGADGSSSTDAPKTGDHTNVFLWGAVMVMALAAVLGAGGLYIRKRRK